MTAWLVDTHAALWFLADDAQLSPWALATMESGEHTLVISAACVWEIAIKRVLGKLTAPADLPEVLVAEGFDTLDVTVAHAWRVAALPTLAHKDPFDRLLIVQAQVEGLPVISADAALDGYDLRRHW